MTTKREPGLEASLWYATAAPGPRTEPLKGDVQADVAIIGAGFTGCSAALHLAEAGASVVTLESKEIGWGGSGRNMGLVNSGVWLDPDAVVKRLGPNHGERLLDGLGHAPELVSELIGRHGIGCDVVRQGVLRGAHNAKAMAGLTAHARQWQRRGANVELLDHAGFERLSGSAHHVGGLVDHRSFTIQPLSYARGLAHAAMTAGARLHERSPALSVASEASRWRVSTAQGSVSAATLIVATNAYSDGLWPGMKQAIIPVGCYVYATEPLAGNLRNAILPGQGAFYDTQPAMVFARYDRDWRLIFGSLGYLPRGATKGARAWPQRTLRYLFPQLGEQRLSHAWAGTLGFTRDHLPRICEPAPGVHMALGYNGRGIAPGTYWGKMLAKRVLGAPASDFPLPVTPIARTPLRGLRATFYETAFRSYRLRSLFH
jgi:glycine/D-amino acid oxidase-like deaminating enzyme